VDPLEVTRPMADVSWTSQSPPATSPSVLIRQPTRTSPGPWPSVASHVFGPSTTQVDPDSPDRPETGISPWFPPDSRSLPRLDPGSLPWQDHRSLHSYHTETTGPLHWSQTEDPGPLHTHQLANATLGRKIRARMPKACITT